MAPPAYLGSVFAPPVFPTVKIVPMTYGATTSGISRHRVVPRAYEHPTSRDFAPHTYESRAVLPHTVWFRLLRSHIPADLLALMCPNTRLLELVCQPVAHDFSRERALFPKHAFPKVCLYYSGKPGKVSHTGAANVRGIGRGTDGGKGRERRCGGYTVCRQ